MFTYNYVCNRCGKSFEVEATLKEKESGSDKFQCPHCRSKDIRQKFSPVSFLKGIFSKNDAPCSCGGGVCSIEPGCDPNRDCCK